MGLDTLIDAGVDRAQRGRGAPDSRPDRIAVMARYVPSSLEKRVCDLQLEETVKFLGRLPEEQIPLCYAAADCFVLPTRALECFGLIVLESFAAGTPVIASRVAAIPELAQIQGDNWLFEPGNPADLADRMEAFLTGRLTPSANVRAFAERFDRPEILEKWSEILFSGSRQMAAIRSSPHSLVNRAARTGWVALWLMLGRSTPRFLHGWRRLLLRICWASVQLGARPYPSCRIWAPWNVTLGEHSCLSERVDCYSVDRIVLGAFAVVSQDAVLCTATHDYNVQDFSNT